jgi:hypothetical protein
MKVKELHNKRVILNCVKSLGDDFNEFDGLSFSEVIIKITNEVKAFDDLVLKNENEVIDKFKNIYLKKFSEEGRFFGNELEVIYIKNLTPNSYNTDYKRCYLPTGVRLNFSSIGPSYREFDTNSHSLLSHKELLEYDEITEDEFNTYLASYNRINGEMKKVLKNK